MSMTDGAAPAAASWANARLPDMIKDNTVGETVNVHVVVFAKEPQPDFARMQRLIAGEDKRSPAPVETDRDGTR